LTSADVFAEFLQEMQVGMDSRSIMLMIAGPNGAGKTTLWNQALKPHFGVDIGDFYINADEIEREFHAPEHRAQPKSEDSKAAQIEATSRRKALLKLNPAQQHHFVYETVFSDPNGIKLT
jgi:predicted ABC-type ATPase